MGVCTLPALSVARTLSEYEPSAVMAPVVGPVGGARGGAPGRAVVGAHLYLGDAAVVVVCGAAHGVAAGVIVCPSVGSVIVELGRVGVELG